MFLLLQVRTAQRPSHHRILGLRPDESNITSGIADKIGRNLHLQKTHPLSILKSRIERYFKESGQSQPGAPRYQFFDSLPPRVTVKQNFDELGIPPGCFALSRPHQSQSTNRGRNPTRFITLTSSCCEHIPAHTRPSSCGKVIQLSLSLEIAIEGTRCCFCCAHGWLIVTAVD